MSLSTTRIYGLGWLSLMGLGLCAGSASARGFSGVGGYFSFHHGDGGLPEGIASSTGAETSADGHSVKLYGECGPITGAQFESGFVLDWGGSYEGTIAPGDVYMADVDLSVQVSGGDLEWSFYTDLWSNEGFENARILTSPVAFGGELSGVHLESSPFTAEGSTGILGGYVYIGWSNYGPTDTFSITIPPHSIDLNYAPVPEPAMGCAGAASMLLGRRRRASAL